MATVLKTEFRIGDHQQLRKIFLEVGIGWVTGAAVLSSGAPTTVRKGPVARASRAAPRLHERRHRGLAPLVEPPTQRRARERRVGALDAMMEPSGRSLLTDWC